MTVNTNRYRIINAVKPTSPASTACTPSSSSSSSSCVVYWMNRDQRLHDNHSLLLSQELAAAHKVPLQILFPFFPKFDSMSYRQYHFMAEGLKELSREVRKYNIPFHVIPGDPGTVVPSFCAEYDPIAVVTDAFPLRTVRHWKSAVISSPTMASIPLYECDASNVVPVWVAADKQQVGARTLRPRINSHLSTYLTEFQPVTKNKLYKSPLPPVPDFDSLLKNNLDACVDRTVSPVSWLVGGTSKGMSVFDKFLQERLKDYGDDRNDPNKLVASDMSPYLRFGQVSYQRLALTIKKHKKHSSSTATFIEEGLVRRELSDNYCHYNENYDNLNGAADWARLSLELHAADDREFLYSEQQLNGLETHDNLWNASQKQLMNEGKMHGFLRMYWAKKILEWTESPAAALRIAQLFNDKYALDGNSCNGYVGVGWSVMGVHDMGWKVSERAF